MLRTCPTGKAWFDDASAVSTAHALAECANRVRLGGEFGRGGWEGNGGEGMERVERMEIRNGQVGRGGAEGGGDSMTNEGKGQRPLSMMPLLLSKLTCVGVRCNTDTPLTPVPFSHCTTARIHDIDVRDYTYTITHPRFAPQLLSAGSWYDPTYPAFPRLSPPIPAYPRLYPRRDKYKRL